MGKGLKMTIRQQGGVFDRNSSFNEVTVGNDIAKLTSGATSTVDFLIAKRDATTGAFEGTLYSNTTKSLTANLPLQLSAGTCDSADTRLIQNEMLYAVINSASVAFTMGTIELEVIN